MCLPSLNEETVFWSDQVCADASVREKGRTEAPKEGNAKAGVIPNCPCACQAVPGHASQCVKKSVLAAVHMVWVQPRTCFEYLH